LPTNPVAPEIQIRREPGVAEAAALGDCERLSVAGAFGAAATLGAVVAARFGATFAAGPAFFVRGVPGVRDVCFAAGVAAVLDVAGGFGRLAFGG
jgi:hypothetical protein